MARPLPAIIALMLLLPALAMLAGPGGAQIPPEVTFTYLNDYPVDQGTDYRYDTLVIEVRVDVTQEGAYTFLCTLTVDASGTPHLIDSVYSDHWLDEGVNTVLLEFPSEPIFRTGISGVFNADVEIQKFDYSGKWEINYQTRFYDHTQFFAPENPPPTPPDAPTFEAGPNSINVSTEYFQVFVNRTSPTIVFRYRDTDPGMPAFIVTYSRLILFQDDGDRIYDGDTPTASVLLANHPWVPGSIEVSGPSVSFDLHGRIPVATDTGFVAVNMTFTFTVTNGTIANPEDSGFIRGDASELKVDILVQPDAAIPDVNYAAIEALVRDSDGSHDFMVEESRGYVQYPRTEETDYLPVPRLSLAPYTQVGLVSGELVWHAFVGWQNLARERWSDGEVHQVDVGASFRVRSGQMELLTAYPFEEGLVSLDHDPSVGTVEENRPPEPLPPPGPEEEAPNPYVFWFAMIAGAVIILLTLYARAQGY